MTQSRRFSLFSSRPHTRNFLKKIPGNMLTRSHRAAIALLVAFPLAMLLLVFPAKSTHAASPACALSVSGETTVATWASIQGAGLGHWPDTKLGVVKNGNAYNFFGSKVNSTSDITVEGTTGTLDNPISGGILTNNTIQGLKHSYNYASGGKIYTNTANGTLIMLYHAETWVNGDYRVFYTQLGLARSTDSGRTWYDMGEIVSPHTPYSNSLTQPVDLGDGTMAVVNSGGTNYLYVYFIEPGMATVAVARAPLADVLNAVENQGTVPAFYKYYQGAWNEPGEGGRASNTDTTNGNMGYEDVSYNSASGVYLMIGFVNWPATELHMLESSDGLFWGNRQVVFNQPGENYPYMSIVGLGDNPNVSGSSFYLYYIFRDDTNWTSTIKRRTLSCSGSGIVSGKTYKIVNARSGNVLHEAGDLNSGWRSVGTYQWTGATYQQWIITDLGNGYYKLGSVATSSVLHEAGNLNNGWSSVGTYSWYGGIEQQWSFVDLGGGVYKIVSRQTGNVLHEADDLNSGWRTVGTYPWTGTNYQKWQLVQLN